jgi:hypothetical protein
LAARRFNSLARPRPGFGGWKDYVGYADENEFFDFGPDRPRSRHRRRRRMQFQNRSGFHIEERRILRKSRQLSRNRFLARIIFRQGQPINRMQINVGANTGGYCYATAQYGRESSADLRFYFRVLSSIGAAAGYAYIASLYGDEGGTGVNLANPNGENYQGTTTDKLRDRARWNLGDFDGRVCRGPN